MSSTSASFAVHVPFLRRFARGLTGSQDSGDAYTLATLQALVEKPDQDLGVTDKRQMLFKCFLKIWMSISINRRHHLPPSDSPIDAADRTLDAITPLPRVAFLLRTLEDFRVEEISLLLDRTVADVDELLATANSEIAEQLSTDVLIIEDEPVIAMDLEALVTDLGHRVTHIASTRKEAVAAIREHRPGLALADIQLADGSSGLDAINEIIAEFPMPVIFITAYPERLLTGRRPEPTFLITKPFHPETVMAVISQALFFDRRVSRPGQVS